MYKYSWYYFISFHLWVLDRSWGCMHFKLKLCAMHHKNVSANINSFSLDIFSEIWYQFFIHENFIIIFASFLKKNIINLYFWLLTSDYHVKWLFRDLFRSYISISECPGVLSKLVTLSCPGSVWWHGSCPPGLHEADVQHPPGDLGWCTLSWLHASLIVIPGMIL